MKSIRMLLESHTIVSYVKCSCNVTSWTLDLNSDLNTGPAQTVSAGQERG